MQCNIDNSSCKSRKCSKIKQSCNCSKVVAITVVIAAAEAGEAVAVAKLVSMGLAILTESSDMATCMFRPGALQEAQTGMR